MSDFESTWQLMIPMTLIVTTSLSSVPGIPVTIHQEDDKWNTVENSHSDYYADIVKKIESLRILRKIQSLEPNWNGYQADSIPLEVIGLSRNIVMNLDAQPEIYPTGRGTIQMQYELFDRSYLEFEIYTDRINVLSVPKRIYDDAIEYSIEANKYYKLNEIVKKFMYS